ncbi:U2-associated SR140 protein [Halteromyces radiatus]|uniref:U2-associated SR140 protein n=1 Tax=Halteromyces radiatus TaxID=101107 RepID=UPI00221F4164|nr:U2-associated SR140 protein [Halteromyces radiatus]KAI8093106.1 U2-associated SR140 protein [Halteromyces radiatus]
MSNKNTYSIDNTEYSKHTSTRPQNFTMVNKKTPFQRHKEETELKKKKENEEAAKIYEDFVASFENSTYDQGTSGFVRASKDQTNRTLSSSASDNYKPMSFVKAGESKATTAMTNNSSHKRTHRQSEKDMDDDDDNDVGVLAQMKQAKSTKKRHMDSFLEEIKKEQQNRAKGQDTTSSISSGHDNSSGSHDNGDPHTTNLFLSDLNPAVNENILCAEFGKYGPIASVKVMWPRTDEEIERQRNCGFVSFMTRKDAAAALDGMNGKVVLGHTMKVGWGKPVPLPAQPIFVLDKRDEQKKLPFNAKVVDRESIGKRTEVVVIPPSDINTIKIIHRTIERVIKYGPLFEELIMEKEASNPQFVFLFDSTHPDHIYYRWRLYSILQGDTMSNWRTDPFQMFDDGEWWIPPDVPDVPFDENETTEQYLDTDDEANERTQQRLPKGQLGKIGRRRYETMLRQVTYQRGTIAKPMAFAIEHADAYEDIVEITFKSIIGPNATITSKIARLFLVSDILHNSSVHVTNAWRYRDGFQRRLPDIFKHLNDIYRSITARLKAEQFRRYIITVLGAWENWMVFPKHFIEKLDSIFMKKSDQILDDISINNKNDEEHSITGVDSNNEKNDSNDQTIPLASNNSIDQSAGNPDGEALDDIDGEALDDIDGEALGDIDGEALDDIDGEAFDDNEHL